MPSFCIRLRSVLGWRFRMRAAPRGPSTRQLVWRRTARMNSSPVSASTPSTIARRTRSSLSGVAVMEGRNPGTGDRVGSSLLRFPTGGQNRLHELLRDGLGHRVVGMREGALSEPDRRAIAVQVGDALGALAEVCLEAR